MSVRYRAVAAQVVRHAYRFRIYRAWSLAQLIEVACADEVADHILCENRSKQAERLAKLEGEVKAVLKDYELRRLRSPLKPAPIATGSFVPAFVEGDEGEHATHLCVTPRLIATLGTLTPREFELLCGAVMSIVGCNGVTVTKASKDDGVDAVGALALRRVLGLNTPLFRLAGSISFLVYMQAKRYSDTNPVKQEAVMQLAGSWEAMRQGFADRTLQEGQMVALANAEYRAADPVLLIMMTSGNLTSGALRKALTLGVIALDGEQIAQLLLEAGWVSATPEEEDELPSRVTLKVLEHA